MSRTCRQTVVYNQNSVRVESTNNPKVLIGNPHNSKKLNQYCGIVRDCVALILSVPRPKPNHQIETNVTIQIIYTRRRRSGSVLVKYYICKGSDADIWQIKEQCRHALWRRLCGEHSHTIQFKYKRAITWRTIIYRDRDTMAFWRQTTPKYAAIWSWLMTI